MFLHNIVANRLGGVDQQHRSRAALGSVVTMIGIPAAFQGFPCHPTGEQHPGKASVCNHVGGP